MNSVRNSPRWRHVMFLIAHLLLIVFAVVVTWECSSILRAGL